MAKVTFTINGKTIEAEEGQTILKAAQAAGIHIPTLCYHRDLTPTGNCRICVVEVEKQRFLQAACVFPVSAGMVVHTHSERVIKSRRRTLELMLANHPQDCLVCDAGRARASCKTWPTSTRSSVPEWGSKGTRYKADSDPNPFVRVDLNKCILCRRCVLACAEIQGRNVWGVAYRGFDEQIVAGAGVTMLEARCESCGQCVGLLSDRGAQRQDVARPGPRAPGHQSHHDLHLLRRGLPVRSEREGQPHHRVTSNPNAPVNGMALCVKGRYGYDFIHHPDRLTKPKVRKYLLDGRPEVARPRLRWVEVDWDTALNITANKLREARDTHGADSVGVLTSAKCLNEENYLMNKFARQVIGTNNIDHCARL